MALNENQIETLITYQSDFSAATSELKNYLATQSKLIKDKITELKASLKGTKGSERAEIQSELNLLKEKSAAIKSLKNQYTTMKKRSSDAIKIFKESINEEVNGVKRLQEYADKLKKDSLDNELSVYKLNRKAKQDADKKFADETQKLAEFSKQLQKDSIAEETRIFKSNRKAKQDDIQQLVDFSNKLQRESLDNELKTHNLNRKAKQDADKKFADETQKLNNFAANLDKESLAEELTSFKNNRRAKLDAEKESQRARAKTAIGALENGTTFGHKVVTTTEYALAGTAIFGVASAISAMISAALEADLNMRTMAAVMRLNMGEALNLDSTVRKLGETYGGTTGEIEQVAIALGRAGVKTKDVKDATEVVLAMARLTGDTFEQSASAVISYQQVFGDTKNITELGNKLAYIANVSRLSTQDIGTFSNYALAAAKDVGLTEDAVGGLAAAFSNAGVNASTIGTQIRRFTSLLTESSTDVTNFFRGIGVNQANLLIDLQKGGKTSNKAMLEFVNTLSKVDGAKFTGLVGQMDILAGNSLKLMRNNSANITKYVQDLQTGVSDQLDNTKVILDSYIVTFESMWNKIKNLGSDVLQSDTMSGLLTGISVAASIALGNTAQAQNEFAALHKKTLEKELVELEKSNNDKLITDYEYLQKRADIQGQLLQVDKSINALRVKETKLTNDEMLKNTESQINILNSKLASGTLNQKETEANAIVLSQLLDKKKDLIKVEKEQNTSTDNLIKKTIDSSMALDKQLTVIAELKSAKMDTSYQEKLFNDTADSTIEKNKLIMKEQLNNLDKYVGMKERLSSIINNAKGNSSELDKLLASRTLEIQNTKATSQEDKDALLAEANVIKTIRDINNDNTIILGKKAKLIGNNLKDEEKAQRVAEKEQKILDENDQYKTKISELSKQILGDETLTLGKLESKLNVDAQLLALAYEKYTLAKGTADESAKERDYNKAMAVYLDDTLRLSNAITAKEQERTKLKLELDSGLDSAIEKEQVRLGIIEKTTSSEYDQLKLKYEKALVDDKLNEQEKEYYRVRLNELDTLNNKRKDVSTLAMEYQRQINEDNTLGYNVAKAGLSSLESGMMDFFDVTSKGWLDWHSLVKGILGSIYKELLQTLFIKQMVSGIAGAISSSFSTPSNVSSVNPTGSPVITAQPSYGDSLWNADTSNYVFAMGGEIPTKGYANGGVLSGGTGIRDDIYLGNVSGTQVFAMGGEFITRKDSVNDNTKGTLDYINKTGTVPNTSNNVNVPVSINIENQTGQNINADMISQLTKQNSNGDYEKVVNIILKAAQVDPRVKSVLKSR